MNRASVKLRHFPTLAMVLALSAQHAVAQEAPVMLAGDDRLNAILWTMTSAEFEAAMYTGYATARAQLDAALADKTRTALPEQTGKYSKLPPAIIMDVDETILDNGPYQVRLMNNTEKKPADLMTQWVEEANAKPLPGAAEFIAYAQSKRVTIFYITNRNAEKEAATRKNLVALHELHARHRPEARGSGRPARRMSGPDAPAFLRSQSCHASRTGPALSGSNEPRDPRIARAPGASHDGHERLATCPALTPTPSTARTWRD